jgi:OPA family glycerol-3-phosphate transporter-like MFS transporter
MEASTKNYSDFSFRRWINFLSLWITYASFYTARQNLAVAQPAMEIDLKWSKTDLGLISTCFAVAYAIGQVVNGQLADRWGGKRLILTGIAVSIAVNILFSMTNSLLLMCILWTLNGFFLATGVPSNARINANWYAVHERGKYLGLFSTCGQAGAVFGFLLAGFVISVIDWRWTFIVPSFVLVLIGIQAMIFLKDSPQDAGFSPVENIAGGKGGAENTTDYQPAGFKYTIKFLSTSRPILIMAFTYMLLGIVRNGLNTWIPTYLVDEHSASFDSAAYKSVILPFIGCGGCIAAGWISDRFFNARRAPICVIMMILLAGFLILFRMIPPQLEVMSILSLGMAGFMLLGPYTLITTIAALDFGGKKAAASAAGFIDGMAYVGMALSGAGLGFIIDNSGWNGCFAVWIGSSILAAFLMMTMWRKKAE